MLVDRCCHLCIEQGTTYWFMRTINLKWSTIESINKQNNQNQFWAPTDKHPTQTYVQKTRYGREWEWVTHCTSNKKISQWWKLSSDVTRHISTTGICNLLLFFYKYKKILDSGELTFNRFCWNTQHTPHTHTHTAQQHPNDFSFHLMRLRAMTVTVTAAILLLMQTNMSLFQLGSEREAKKKIATQH